MPEKKRFYTKTTNFIRSGAFRAGTATRKLKRALHACNINNYNKRS